MYARSDAAPESARIPSPVCGATGALTHISLASRTHLVTSRHATSLTTPSHVNVGLRGGEVVSYVVQLALEHHDPALDDLLGPEGAW